MIALNDRVIVKVGAMPEKLKSGIFLPTVMVKDGQAKVNVGKVLSHGPGITLRTGEFISVSVKKDQVIMWEQYGGINFEVLGPNIVCIRSEDAGCVMEPHEYEGWVFDEEELDKKNKEFQAELEEIKRVQNEKQLENARQIETYVCDYKDCNRVRKPISKRAGDNKQCEYCGVEMIPYKDKNISLQIFTQGGASNKHTRS